jgi:hypothetical protein
MNKENDRINDPPSLSHDPDNLNEGNKRSGGPPSQSPDQHDLNAKKNERSADHLTIKPK